MSSVFMTAKKFELESGPISHQISIELQFEIIYRFLHEIQGFSLQSTTSNLNSFPDND